MSEVHDLWVFGRKRFLASLSGLSEEQANWRLHNDAHTIIEITYHLAGAEHFWWARLNEVDPDSSAFDARLDSAVYDGFLRDGECPFAGEELTVANALAVYQRSGELIEPILMRPTADQLHMKLTSPIGDLTTGADGLIRLASHAPYHGGQVWMMRMHPDFPL